MNCNLDGIEYSSLNIVNLADDEEIFTSPHETNKIYLAFGRYKFKWEFGSASGVAKYENIVEVNDPFIKVSPYL